MRDKNGRRAEFSRIDLVLEQLRRPRELGSRRLSMKWRGEQQDSPDTDELICRHTVMVTACGGLIARLECTSVFAGEEIPDAYFVTLYKKGGFRGAEQNGIVSDGGVPLRQSGYYKPRA